MARYRVRVEQIGNSEVAERHTLTLPDDAAALDWQSRYWNAHFATGEPRYRCKLFRRGERKAFCTIG